MKKRVQPETPPRAIYLDHHAATPLLPEAREAMLPFLGGEFGNPSSPHRWGLRARAAVETARQQMAALLQADSPENIIFTADATEAANLAVKGAAWAGQSRGRHIVLSQIEHPSVEKAVQFLERHGFTATRVPVDGRGWIDPAAVRRAVKKSTILITTHWAHHEIGVIQPVREISAIAGERGVLLHVDADAAAGWLPLDSAALGADLLTFSAQRFYGPKGAGVVWRGRRGRLVPLHHGGDQENGWRAGVENVAAIVGAGAAAAAARRHGAAWNAHCAGLQQRLWDLLKSRLDGVRLNGPPCGPGRLSTNLNVSVGKLEAGSLVLLCDLNGLAISGAGGCLGRSPAPSPVLEALGLPPARVRSAVALSLGKDNTLAEIKRAAATLGKAAAKLSEMSPARG